MTIVFQGHVERIEQGPGNKLSVHIRTEMEKCGQVVVLHVPPEAAGHWLPGRSVSFTAYAFDPANPVAVPVPPSVRRLGDEASKDELAVLDAYAEGCKRG